MRYNNTYFLKIFPKIFGTTNFLANQRTEHFFFIFKYKWLGMEWKVTFSVLSKMSPRTVILVHKLGLGDRTQSAFYGHNQLTLGQCGCVSDNFEKKKFCGTTLFFGLPLFYLFFFFLLSRSSLTGLTLFCDICSNKVPKVAGLHFTPWKFPMSNVILLSSPLTEHPPGKKRSVITCNKKFKPFKYCMDAPCNIVKNTQKGGLHEHSPSYVCRAKRNKICTKMHKTVFKFLESMYFHHFLQNTFWPEEWIDFRENNLFPNI